MTDHDDPRRIRLARALRANLRRRKSADVPAPDVRSPEESADRDDPPALPDRD